MDEDGEEFVAQKTRMWSIKLRGAVFRLQIQAINTFETPIKINWETIDKSSNGTIDVTLKEN